MARLSIGETRRMSRLFRQHTGTGGRCTLAVVGLTA
jgi:hypothetical protein